MIKGRNNLCDSSENQLGGEIKKSTPLQTPINTALTKIFNKKATQINVWLRII